MRIDVFTLFPGVVRLDAPAAPPGQRGPLGGPRAALLLAARHHPLGHGQVDDSPYGGGPGMVIRVDVMAAALEAVYGEPAGRVRDGRRVIVLTPRGRPFTDAVARELAARARDRAPVRTLRGLRRARARGAGQRRDLPRALRAGRRGGGGDGRHRRRRPAPGGRPRQRREPGGGVVLGGARGADRAPPLHAPGPLRRPRGAPRCCCRATTAPSPAGATSARWRPAPRSEPPAARTRGDPLLCSRSFCRVPGPGTPIEEHAP